MSLVALAMIRYSTPGDKSGKIKTIDYVLAVLSLITGLYIILSTERLVFRTPFFDPILPLDIVFGTIAILLVLEATRRTVGYPLAIVALIMMAYTFFGKYIPGMFGHRGFTFERLIEQMFLTTNGIFGGSVGIASSYVLMFVIFGEFLNRTGGGDFFLISHELLPALLRQLGQNSSCGKCPLWFNIRKPHFQRGNYRCHDHSHDEKKRLSGVFCRSSGNGSFLWRYDNASRYGGRCLSHG